MDPEPEGTPLAELTYEDGTMPSLEDLARLERELDLLVSNWWPMDHHSAGCT